MADLDFFVLFFSGGEMGGRCTGSRHGEPFAIVTCNV